MPTMTPVSAGGAPYQVPPEPSRWPSIALAAAVHAGLLAFLYIGVNWQNTQPVQVEAEVWDMKTQSAAPPPPPPPEVVEPEPEPQPAPAPKVVEPPPPPPRVEQPVAPKPPDIALEREKQKAEKRKQLEEKKLEEQKLAKERKAEELAEKKAQELADKKAQELADKKAAQKAQLEDKKLAEKKLEEKKLADKLKADKLAKAADAAEQKRLDKMHADEMRRIAAGAGESGEAPKSTASRLDTSYLAAINSKIKGATSYPGSTDVPGRPEVVFKIEQLPTGEIISVRLQKSSGIPAFDDAVEKGILKSSPLPKNKNGTVLRTLEIAFAMKDLK
ncbi:MAG: Protein TolA [Massilia sp.]|nr:Protein TolA [Massilia sp.]